MNERESSLFFPLAHVFYIYKKTNHMANQQDDKKYPGYPHYPAAEDITSHGNNTGRMPANEDGTQTPLYNATDMPDDEVNIVSGTDADITEEDIRDLEAADQDMATTDSSNLQQSALDSVDDDGDPLNEESSLNMDMSGQELDVPGSEADDADEAIGKKTKKTTTTAWGAITMRARKKIKGNSHQRSGSIYKIRSTDSFIPINLFR